MRKLFFAGLLAAGSVVAWSGCSSPEPEPIDEPAEVEVDIDEELETDDLPDSNTTY